MASSSFLKGGLFSSTPVQSLDDSGYIGSGQRRFKSNLNALSCSPINESTVKNASETFLFQNEFYDIPLHLGFDDNSDLVNVKNYSLSSVEVNELSELEFTASNFSSENEMYKSTPSTSRLKEKLTSLSEVKTKNHIYNSLSVDKDIDYKLFDVNYFDDFTNIRQKTDFIHELNVRSCSFIISNILLYLSPKELCKASCVNKEWNDVISKDLKANARKKKFIQERHYFLNGPLKENRLGVKYNPTQDHKRAFSSVTNKYAAEDLPLVSKVLETRFDSFLGESRTEEKLQKCPKCSYASKYLDKNKCLCTRCSYKFCSLCLGPLLKGHSCFKVPFPTNIIVGSRKSRNNLKRL